MDRMVVITFDNEKAAYEATKALKNIHDEGSIALYAAAVVAKDSDGKVSVKEAADEGPLGTAVGMLSGTFVGLLGAAAGAGPAGPVIALGMGAGTIIGAMADLTDLGIDADFLDEVNAQLAPGKVAVVAECYETWMTPIDTAMEKLGGTVFRRYRSDYVDDLIQRDIDQTKADYAALKEELHQAGDDRKAKIQSKMNTSKAKLEASVKRAKDRSEALKHESEAKVKTLDGQIKKARDDAKAKYEKRKTEIMADYEERRTKLHQSWELAGQALKP
jgi:uncharacterized membrane protein